MHDALDATNQVHAREDWREVGCDSRICVVLELRGNYEGPHHDDMPLADIIDIVFEAIDSTTNYIEHPDLVAQRLVRYAQRVGRENVLAGCSDACLRPESAPRRGPECDDARRRRRGPRSPTMHKLPSRRFP